jgi:hypothetical protein
MSLDTLDQPTTATTEPENASLTHPSPFTLNMRAEIAGFKSARVSLIQAQETFDKHRTRLTELLTVTGLDDSALRSLIFGDDRF